MGGNANIDGSALTLQRALDIARNSEGGVDPAITAFLERKLGEVWAKLQAQPNTYVFTKDEFALFNYYRARFGSSEIARSATQRFWDNYNGGSSS
ncbi:hypothetical protein GQ43DRAFT_121204 [Delitschia confertaspora ATCC 74209]|uniref:Uncharacterized protein n=1 Tax=Delitschia confertaspora ATCC 74209 TaxID=1513339 RepID=A0A9P4MVJ3_9PLEO|nr:hypothetical protein GQ43DRAFT_121204 [Delitschia confertaspora ATCC 74209]